ncbi:MAG: Formamidopyrimidine-DNA glycosylase [Pedosphaera sp.]|nr:Formamidopyrimidine-DNA glycosylase [Pedosphaera sp.]
MPELPEVEILVRHLAPLLKNKTIRGIQVHRAKVISPTSESQLVRTLQGATFTGLIRRGKYLLFNLRPPHRRGRAPILLVGHLGMTGRMYLLPQKESLPKHAAVVLGLGRHNLVYEDTRYFGRFTLDTSSLARLGPEPLGSDFTVKYFAAALKRSAQSIKVKLLDQTLVTGVGNIYASESLFRARVSPKLASRGLTMAQVKLLWRTIREVLAEAIQAGSTVPLDFAGTRGRDGLFYYGSTGNESEFYQERLLVYDRRGQPCQNCRTSIRRLFQAARSTFYCPRCQRA